MLRKQKRIKVWCPAGESIPRTWTKDEKMSRCPACNKRLLPRRAFCVGGEFVGWYIGPHKKFTREKK
jgi:hypothetical protein